MTRWIGGLSLALSACAGSDVSDSPFSTSFGPSPQGPIPAAYPDTDTDTGGVDTETAVDDDLEPTGDGADTDGEAVMDTTDGEAADGTGEPDGAGESGGLSGGCDPLFPDCGPGEACYPLDGAFVCAIDVSGGDGVALEPCEFVNVCNPGLACADAGAMPSCIGALGCCTPYCDLDAANPCSQGVCTPYFAPGTAPAGFEAVGWCLGY